MASVWRKGGGWTRQDTEATALNHTEATRGAAVVGCPGPQSAVPKFLQWKGLRVTEHIPQFPGVPVPPGGPPGVQLVIKGRRDLAPARTCALLAAGPSVYSRVTRPDWAQGLRTPHLPPWGAPPCTQLQDPVSRLCWGQTGGRSREGNLRHHFPESSIFEQTPSCDFDVS